MISTKSILLLAFVLAGNLLAGNHRGYESSAEESAASGYAEAWFDYNYMPKLQAIAQQFGKFSYQVQGYHSLNFGVLVNNKYHHIYRSKALGEEGTQKLFRHMVYNKLPLPTRVVFINKDGFKKKMWAKIPYVSSLVRGTDNFAMQEHAMFHPLGQFPTIEFWHPLNNDVYLSGHNPLNDVTDYHAAKYTDEESSREFEVHTHSLISARKENFYRILELILNNEGAVLFHCTGGLHRTGMVAMAIRHLQGGEWTQPFAEPIRILTLGSLSNGQEIYLQNLAEVEYVLHNPNNVRLDNLEAVRDLVKEARFQELYQQYNARLNATE